MIFLLTERDGLLHSRAYQIVALTTKIVSKLIKEYAATLRVWREND
jgi:hypothetical protein